MKQLARLTALLTLALSASAVAEDWPMFGRDGSRNMASPAKNLPVSFKLGKLKDNGIDLDLAGAVGVKWVAKLGSAAYGNPTVAGGRVYVGTNNDPGRDPRRGGDYGVVLCLDEQTGKLLWQLTAPKLAAGKVSDYEHIGICSSPTVDGERVYLVTNRCEVLCLDAAGLANGNDGPFTDEAQYIAGPGKPKVELSPTDADIIWRYDMRDELGVFPNSMTSSSVLVVGDRLYVTTSNGVHLTHTPAPNAPALICLDKKTGKLLGQEISGISRRTFYGNWSSPALATVSGQQMIVFGADDGFCYGFDPVPAVDARGGGVLKELWRFDCNPPQYRFADGKPQKYSDAPKGPCGIIATPVFHDNRIYVAIGREPEQGDGAGCLNCIDPTGTGDITAKAKVWSNDKIGRSISTVAVADGLVYAAEFAGFVHCLDVKTGEILWSHDTMNPIWGSTLVADGKVYIGNGGGQLTILAAGREKKVIGVVQIEGSVFSTPIVANGVLFIATEKHLYAVK